MNIGLSQQLVESANINGAVTYVKNDTIKVLQRLSSEDACKTLIEVLTLSWFTTAQAIPKKKAQKDAEPRWSNPNRKSRPTAPMGMRSIAYHRLRFLLAEFRRMSP